MANEHLGRAVEARLDIGVHRMRVEACRAKVDQFELGGWEGRGRHKEELGKISEKIKSI